MIGGTLGIFKIQAEDLLLTPKNPDGLLELNLPVTKNNITVFQAKVFISVSTYITPEEQERIRDNKSKMVQVRIYAQMASFHMHTLIHTLIHINIHVNIHTYVDSSGAQV